VAASGDDLYALMDCLRDAGVAIDGVRTIHPDLEDVFVEMTAGKPDRPAAIDRPGPDSEFRRHPR